MREDVLKAEDDLIVLEEYRDGGRACPGCVVEGGVGTPAPG